MAKNWIQIAVNADHRMRAEERKRKWTGSNEYFSVKTARAMLWAAHGSQASESHVLSDKSHQNSEYITETPVFCDLK